MVDFPKFTIREMLECGVHFGHKQRAWNPKMDPFIYGARNGVHIIDLQKTFLKLSIALKAVEQLILKKPNAKILFVGTKHQASDHVKESAMRCGQFYVDRRWLGGTLTNWNTVSKSIVTLENLEKKIATFETNQEAGYVKKEVLNIKRHAAKLERVLGGIRKLKGRPDMMFVIGANTEHIAIKEAQKFHIPIIAIVDTNSNPNGIDYVVPGNDDSSKSIKFFTTLMSNVILYATAKVFEESGVMIEDFKQDMEVAEQDAPISDESITKIDEEASEFFNVGGDITEEDSETPLKEAVTQTKTTNKSEAKKPKAASKSEVSPSSPSLKAKAVNKEEKPSKTKVSDKNKSKAVQENITTTEENL